MEYRSRGKKHELNQADGRRKLKEGIRSEGSIKIRVE